MATVYATRANLASFGLPAVVLADISTADQDAALASASAVADSYLRAQFTLPLTQWGGDLTERVCHLAAWNLLTTLGFNPERGADAAVRQRYDDAVRWFEGVAAGRVNPALSDSRPDARAPAPRLKSNSLRGW